MIGFKFKPVFKDYLMLQYFATKKYYLILFVGALLFSGLCVATPFLTLFFVNFVATQSREPSASTTQMVPSESGWMLLIYASIPWILLTFTLLATYWQARHRFIVSPEVNEEREFEINTEGIHVKAASSSGMLQWINLTQATYAHGYFFILTTQRMYHYFPASILPNISEFADLLGKNVGAIKGYRNRSHPQ
jgi:hypothetical protein